MIALVFTAFTNSRPAAQKVERMPDRTVEITRKDGKLVFIEHGKEKAEAIPIVVGQTLRWKNRDSQPHELESIQTVSGKPLFHTGIIEPGKHKDILFDIDMYQHAGEAGERSHGKIPQPDTRGRPRRTQFPVSRQRGRGFR